MTTEQLAEQTKADAARMRRAPQALLQQCRDVLVDDMRRGIAEGHSPDGTPFAPLAFPRVGGGGGPLLGRNNSIAASIGSVTRYGPDSVEVGTNHPHAAVHQRGGIIRPHGQFLAMPRTPEALAAGRARNFPRKLFPIVGLHGGVLAERQGRGKAAKVTAHYALARYVVEPARAFVGVSARALAKLGELVADWFAGKSTG